MTKEKPLKVLRRARKSFFWEYGCGIFLFGLLGFAKLKGIVLNPTIVYFVGGLGIVSLASAELSRFFIRYDVTESKITIVNGVLRRTRKHVYFHPLGFVPDLNVKQGLIQRLLGFGTIGLKGGEGHTFEIKDVNRPHKVLEMIEELIEKNKRP